MKALKIKILCIAFLLPLWVCSQQEGAIVYANYEQRALIDAKIEQALIFESEEDELDYWKDQYNFEKRLKKENYSAYKSYIQHKRKLYLLHQQNCDIQNNHGKGYMLQASFYMVQGDYNLTLKRNEANPSLSTDEIVGVLKHW